MTHKQLIKKLVAVALEAGWQAGGGGKPDQITVTFRKIK